MLECSEFRSTVEWAVREKTIITSINCNGGGGDPQQKFNSVNVRNNKVEVKLTVLASSPALRKAVSSRLLWTMY